MVQIEIILFRNDKTLAEQQRWWIEDHAPLGKKIPGLLSYTINLADTDEGGEGPQICGTDTLTFTDLDAAMRAYNSEEWKKAREHTAASGARALRSWIKETAKII